MAGGDTTCSALDTLSFGFGLGFVFCAILTGALVLVAARTVVGSGTEVPSSPQGSQSE